MAKKGASKETTHRRTVKQAASQLEKNVCTKNFQKEDQSWKEGKAETERGGRPSERTTAIPPLDHPNNLKRGEDDHEIGEEGKQNRFTHQRVNEGSMCVTKTRKIQSERERGLEGRGGADKKWNKGNRWRGDRKKS